MIDVVYILGLGSAWHDNEIRLSLRSVEKYLRGNYQVVIIGHKPYWLKNIIHIECPDPFRSKPKNTCYKLYTYRKHMNNLFVVMNDDFFFSSDINIADLKIYYSGNLSDRLDHLKANNTYKRILKATRDRLLSIGTSELNMELHLPLPVFDLSSFDKMFDDGFFFNFRSIYGNLTDLPRHELQNDVKLFDIPKSIPTPFFSIEDTFLSTIGKELLLDMYPKKSIYEK